MTAPGAIRAFDVGDVERLQEILERFADHARLRCVALVERNGQLLTAVGSDLLNDTAAFASLTAADFAASDRLAELLGEDEFTSLFHQGDLGSMFAVAIGNHAILACLFDQRTTLGLVRVHARTTVPQLAELVAEIATRQPMNGAQSAALGSAWADEAESEIDRLFGF